VLLEEDTKNKLREQLECLELYLTAKKNVDVIFGRDEDNAFYNEQGYITINTRQNLRSQLHSLFHEAGHVLLRSDRKIFNKKYPGLLKRKDSKSFKLGVLKEEMMAWERGYKLAKRLGIDLDEKIWKKHSEECMYDYVKWAVNG
tara:strand:+ start:156 stop:587 length:432 start_codon:yes stop_codon:yes gene_type:complete